MSMFDSCDIEDKKTCCASSDFRYMDHIYVMSYDYFGDWSTTLGHNSALYPSKQEPNSPFNQVNGFLILSLNNGIMCGISE